MKILFFVFLALCGYAAQAESLDELDVSYSADLQQIEPRGPILDGVLNIVKKINTEVRKAIEDIIAKTEDIINDVRTKIENAAKLALDKIRTLVKEVENRLSKLGKSGKAAKVCIDNGRPKIKEAISNVEADNKQCIRGAIEQAKNIVSKIKQHLEDIQDKVYAMEDMVRQCMETNGSVFGLAKCITKQVWEFNKNIFGMIGDVKNMLVEATKSSFRVVTNGIACLADVGRQAEKEISGAVKSIEQCIASNKFEEFKKNVMF